MRLMVRTLLFAILLFLPPLGLVAGDGPPSLDDGFHLMYNLDFRNAEREFSRWEQEHPGNALGLVSEAANLLFSEFERLGILDAQFLLDDALFTSRAKPSPDPGLRTHFNAVLNQAEAMARQRLAQDPQDHDALFALALVNGMRADYAALIENRNLAALKYTRQASEWAGKLLAIAPDYYDAYLSTGISEYILGSLAAPVRWIIRLGGYSGNKTKGIQELKVTAEHGRYLAPFARILLAIAYMRARDRARARELLVSLRNDFPSNPLFAREIERIDSLRN